MTLSANYLIHFTRNIESLKKILETGFMVNLCEETIVLKEKINTFHVPMVSFCDIPLSEIIEHTNHYGKYGIGMTKAWGESKGINPIIYLQKKSLLTKALQASIKLSIKNINKIAKSGEVPTEDLVESARITSYIKNYECLHDHKRYPKGYRFYDEKEWRFVPIETVHGNLVLPHYFDRELEKLGKNAFNEIKLDFTPNDIKYLIIENDDEILEIISHIKAVKKKYADDDIAKLSARILTYDQIKYDI